MNLPCWLTGHDWKPDVVGIFLHIGTPEERQCNVVVCTRCLKAKVSYVGYASRSILRSSPRRIGDD